MVDNQAPHQIQHTRGRLRVWLENIRQNRRRAGFIVGLLLAIVYFILAGVVPAVYIQNHYANGATFISLYSPAFRYPQFFGWMTILLLTPPVLYLTSLPGLNRTRDRALVLFLVALISTFILVIDTQSNNTAPFEIKAEILQSDDQLKNHFTKKELKVEDKTAYQDGMLRLLKDRDNWSPARYLFYLSVFIQIFNILFIFVVTGALSIHGLSPDSDHAYEFKEALVYCSLAILVSYLWLLMRVAFNYQKPNYFPGISNPVADLTVIALFAAATFLVAFRLLSWLPDKFTVIFSLASIFLGFLGALSALTLKETLVIVFGKDSGLVPYFTILVALGSLLIFVVVARKMRVGQKDE